MMSLINQLTPGIALFFAVDTYLNNNKPMKDIVEEFSMLRHIKLDYRDALIEQLAYSRGAFDTQQQSSPP